MIYFWILRILEKKTQKSKKLKTGHFGPLHRSVGNPRRSVALRRSVGCPHRDEAEVLKRAPLGYTTA